MVLTVITALSDAFLAVGVWVAGMLAGFALLQRRTDGWAVGLLGRRGLGPLMGALLGVTPGCGGAVLVMPLYAKGSASFGTTVATLVATMGDSSFVLLAADPLLGLAVHAGLFATGVVSGVVVDALGIAPRRTAAVAAAARARTTWPRPAPSTVGAAAARPGLWGRPRLSSRSPSLVAFYVVVAVGLAISVVDLAGGAASVTAAPTGEDPATALGVVGTLFAVVIAIANRGRPAPPHDHDAPTAAVLTEAARETATIVAWVAAVFLGYEVVVAVTGVDLSGLANAGLLPVLLAALIGLVPGCGPQIVVTSLYTNGAIGLPVLLANAVSQDGDALLPLLARDRRGALAATAATTVPALVVGVGAWLVVS